MGQRGDPGPAGHLRGAARPPAAAHASRLPGAAPGDTGAAQRQGRPRAPPAARRLAPCRRWPGLYRARHRRRAGAGRDAGGTARARARVGGRRVLRRPGHELAAGRALLRPGQGTGAGTASVLPGRLPAPDHPEPGRRGGRARGRSRRHGESPVAGPGVAGRHRAVPDVRRPAAAGLPCGHVPRRGGHLGRLQLAVRDQQPGRDLPSLAGLHRRGLHRPVRPADPGQVDADRPLEARRNTRMDPGLPAFLAGEDAHTRRSAGFFPWLAGLLAVSAGAGGQDRPPCRHPVPERARLHRHAHHR